MMNEADKKSIRVDLQIIADFIEPGSRVLDVGCGNGNLLEYLTRFKQVDGRGIELGTEGVNACVSNGLSVIQGDAETDLKDYPDQAFDYVILGHTLQAMHAPKDVLEQLLRIGRRAIVSFPNFGHWRVRTHLMFKGRMPVSETLPFQWYETPNIHFCTIKDFWELCRQMGIRVEDSVILGAHSVALRRHFLSNVRGEQAVYLLRR